MTDARKTMISEDGETLIDRCLRENIQSKILTHWLKKIFTYLDKFYTKNSAQVPTGTLFQNGLKIYKETVNNYY